MSYYSGTCMEKIMNILVSIKEDNIPEDVQAKAKEVFADFTGIYLNSSTQAFAHRLKDALKETIAGSAEDFALYLGSTARALDIDDGHRFAMAHPGVALNSTAWAMVREANEVSGKKLLQAIVRGYEMYCYLGRVINPSAYLKRGVDATCICGAPAAAVLAGTLMNLTKEQLMDAASLAASLAGGLNQSAVDGSAQKYLVAGWGAKLGIAAANLAKNGMGGPSRVLEGRIGFCNAFAPEYNKDYMENPELIWDIKAVYIKRYACVRRIHATLDAISDIVCRENIKADEIEKINVMGSQFLFEAGGYEPKDPAQAQTSVPYAVALLLKYGCVEDNLVHDNIGNEEINSYSHKIVVQKDEEIIGLAEKDKSLWGAAKVEIITTDGRVFSGRQITPYGDPELPLPERAVEEKFMRNAKEFLTEEQAVELWQTLNAMENIADMKTVQKSLFAKLGF